MSLFRKFILHFQNFMLPALFFFLTIHAFSQLGFSPMKNLEQFKRSLTETAKNTLTMESRFVQEKNLDVISEKIISHGNFFFKQQNNLRWEYTDPYRYLIIINGDKIFVKDENRENRFDASSNQLFSEINAIMIGCIRGTILENVKQFSIEYLENSENYLLKLYPKESRLKNVVAEIRICFIKKTFIVSKIEMHESSGDFTKIIFSGMKLNNPVGDENFRIN